MIARILDSWVVDLILIILAIRFIFPSLFTVKIIRPNRPAQQPFRHNEEGSIHVKTSSKNQSRNKENEGEYIDYEEVK